MGRKPRRETMGKRPELPALTGLRFFAALAIVIHHACGPFFSRATVADWPLDQGVSLFFVLSGFVLTYAYPELPTAACVRAFFIARFARIWPAHIATLLLVGAAVVGWSISGPLAANVLLVQAWIPQMSYYFSYNAVSWSISTEFGFYLLFPLLIRRFADRWHIVLAGSLALLIGLIVLMPSDPAAHAFIYISPLGRLFEFVLGMVAALLWMRAPTSALGVFCLSAAELAIVTLVLLQLRYGTPYLGALGGGQFPGVAEWAWHSGGCVGFALAIVLFAQGKGIIARLLAVAPIAFLGRMSYSLYLLHQPAISLWENYVGKYGAWWDAAFFVLLLGASIALFLTIEQPARRWIRRAYAASPGLRSTARAQLSTWRADPI